MKIYKNLDCEIPDTNTHHFNLEDYSNDNCTDTILCQGYKFINDENFSNTFFENHKNFKTKIYINMTAPTEYNGTEALINEKLQNRFDYIFTICPHTVKWLNMKYNTNKFKYIWYPFNKKHVAEFDYIKKYDIIYHGGIHGNIMEGMLHAMSKYNYQYITMTDYINEKTQTCIKYATKTNISNLEKLKIISQTKISLCANILELNEFHKKNIRMYPSWQDNKAWNHINESLSVQIKSRLFEAAFCKSLNLIYYDYWNIVEDFFVPNEDFIYFYDLNDLKRKIKQILNHWDEYKHVPENAFKKALNYDSENFINKIKKEIN